MTATLLVVDDHAMVREGLKLIFNSAGITVLEAADGESALSIVDVEPIDVVLLDIQLPGADGL
jgi:DNA-binding response OmpR family regulator